MLLSYPGGKRQSDVCDKNGFTDLYSPWIHGPRSCVQAQTLMSLCFVHSVMVVIRSISTVYSKGLRIGLLLGVRYKAQMLESHKKSFYTLYELPVLYSNSNLLFVLTIEKATLYHGAIMIIQTTYFHVKNNIPVNILFSWFLLRPIILRTGVIMNQMRKNRCPRIYHL